MLNELVPLTEAQKRIWITQMIYPKSKMFNIGGKAIMKGDVDPHILDCAIRVFIASHDSLRIRIRDVNGSYMQYISKEQIAPINYYDFSLCEKPYKELAMLEKQNATESFIYFDSQLYDFKIFKLSKDEVGYMVKFHHVIADGWSIEILSEKIQRIYSDIRHKRNIELLEQDSFISHIEAELEYLNSQKYINNKKFWNELYTELPELPSFEDDTTKAVRKQFCLPTDLSKRIKEYVEKTSISISSFFVMSYLIYQYVMKNSVESVVGIPVLGRNNRKEREIFGMFSNTLPMKFIIDEKESCISMGKRVFSLFRKCIGNQNYPYNHLINDLNLMSYKNQRLFECCINYYNTTLTKQYEDISIKNTEFFNGEQEYPMQLIIREWGEKEDIQIDIDYKVALYSNEYVDKFYNELLMIFNEVCNNSEQLVSQLKKLNLNYQVMEQFNNLSVKRPYSETVVQLIENVAEEHWYDIALIEHEEKITYGEFIKRSNSFAYFLQNKGIGHGDIVVLCVEYSIEVLIAILGILKVGAAYLPLDSDVPVKRMEYILQDAKAALLIKNFDMPVNNIYSEILDLRNYKSKKDYLGKNIDESRLEEPAYIIYTSGSTGRPKGVIVHHSSLSNYIHFAKRQYKVTEKDVFPLYSSISFDLTISTVFTPLVSGAAIIIYNKNQYEDFILYEILRENKVTIIKLTPAHLKVIEDYLNVDIRITRYIVGGEEFPIYLARKVEERCGEKIFLFNEYGPTEATVGCMIHQYDSIEDNHMSVPIGIPIDNTRIYLLDNKLCPVGINEIGEIYIAGEALSKGYLNRPDLTKERFLCDIVQPSEFMYRTGDLAQINLSHKMVYLGRIDDQVKINGNRIELQEIQYRLQAYESINAVYVDAFSLTGKKQIHAYFTSDEKIDKNDLICFLSEELPSYMIPGRLVRVKEIPLTSNGKIDKSKIDDYVIEDEICVEEKQKYDFILKRENIEEIKGIFCIILEADKVEESDNFYALGGDSIKAIQISSKLREKKYSIPIKKILSSSTIGEIIKNISVVSEPLMNALDDYVGPVGKSPITEWFFQSNFKEPGYYNQSCVLHINYPVTKERLKNALIQVVKNHASLRIGVNRLDNSMFYRQLENEVLLISYNIEMEQLSEDEMKKRLYMIYNENMSKFDIQEDILIRAIHIKCSENVHKVLFVAHHLVVDAVSWDIIVNDFIAQLEGREILGECASCKQWNDALLIHQDRFLKDLEFWKSIEFYWKEDANSLLSNEISVPYSKTSNKAFEMEFEITKEILQSLKNSYNITLEEFVVCCIVSGIQSLWKMDSFFVEMEKHGRSNDINNIDITRTVGWFTTIFPMYVNIPQKDIYTLLISVKESCRKIPNNGISYGVLKYILGELHFEGQPLYRINFLGTMNKNFNDKKYTVEYNEDLQTISDVNHFVYLLDIISYEKGKRLHFNIRYNNCYISQDIILMYIQLVKSAGEEIVKHCKLQNEIYFTPSDFQFVNLSQEELDSLFE